MTYKTAQTWHDWIFFWATFFVVISLVEEQSLRLLIFGIVLAVQPLYLFVWQRTLDLPGLLGVGGIALMASLMWLHPGLPFFLFAVIVFFGFVIAPIYVSLRRATSNTIQTE